MYQGARQKTRDLNAWLPQDPARIDAIVLSHGHLDHCGKLPVIVKSGYRGPIYATPATIDVARIVLEDSAEIQEENATYLNQRTRDPDEPKVAPLYVRADAHEVYRLLKRVGYRQKTHIASTNGGSGIDFTFYDAGHILGSAYVIIEYQEDGQKRTLLFTADIGRYNTPIIRDPEVLPFAVDDVITESTYGDRPHAPMSEVEPQFLDAVKTIIARKGRLIVPSFAVGRTQTVLWYLNKFVREKSIPRIPIFVDSPMGVDVTRATLEHKDNYDEETLKLIGDADLSSVKIATFASSSAESRQINSVAGPCVIVASSPTCEFGRVLYHLKQSVENANDMVVFVGWIPPQTLGRRLQDRQPRVRILDRWYDVRCEVRTIHGLSAHADAEELLRFLKPTIRKETTAYVVHGEESAAETMAMKLRHAGMGQVVVPAMETSVLTVG
jgi:metallo-beta-lactamase family protein